MKKSKIHALQDWSRSQNPIELRSFYGLVNFYGGFVLFLAHLAAPLIDLMGNNKPWLWESSQEKAFQFLEEMMMLILILQPFNPTFLCVIDFDASDFAIGAVDSMEGPRSVAFEPRRLNWAKKFIQHIIESN